MYIDTHCHLDFPAFDHDRSEALSRAKDNNVEYIVNIGSSLEASRRSLALAREYECIYPTVGCHPHEADKYEQSTYLDLEELAKDSKVVAIGEIGLDYFKNYSDPQNQRQLFKSLIDLANNLNLPIVIHCRQAEEDVLKILEQALPKKAVVHCFSGDDNFLRQCLDLGFFVSFTCNITYKKAQNLRDLVKIVPLDRLFLETDAPFLPPQDLRGMRNEPMYIPQLASEIARIKEISIEEVAQVTTENAKGFFGIGLQ